MWLGLLFDTIETRQGEGDAFLVEGVAFCIAVVAFFRGVMHLGRRVFRLARRAHHLVAASSISLAYPKRQVSLIPLLLLSP